MVRLGETSRNCRVFSLLVPLCLQGYAASTPTGEHEELALVYGNKATVSIATGSAQSIRRAPAVARVITAEEIKAMGAVVLDDVLETVPGLHVSHSPVGYPTVYLYRGIGGGGLSSPQLLLLQNGVPMTTMYSGDKGNAWFGVPVENIARIEIIRGPGSALYGADAYAGVINIMTKGAADTPGTEIGVRSGSFSTGSVWAQHGGKLRAVDVAAFRW